MKSRRLALLAACALLLATGAHAKCKADNPDEDPVTGCTKCAKDGSKCEECGDRYGLASDGTCTPCKVGGYYGDQCLKCDGDKPDLCLTCDAACGRRACTGLFASEGRCQPCGDACSDCAPTGACLNCNRFHGLVNGTCAQCPSSCYNCDGDATKCNECLGGYHLVANGTCVECPGSADGGVTDCDADGKPTQCSYGFFLKGGQCNKCGVANCNDCSDDKACNTCDSGYGPSKKGAKDCVPCKSANCTDCTADSAKCTSCSESFGLVKDACQACAAANCTACDGNVKVCTQCSSNDTVTLGPDAKTGGCSPCAVPQCSSCYTDAAKCDYCKDGYGVDNASGACKLCPPQATSCTINATATVADTCATGYGVDKSTGACVACGVPNCDSCDKLGAGSCDLYGCAEGYGYSDQENTCFKCADGCGACTEASACSWCIDGWAPTDASGKACSKCEAGDRRDGCNLPTTST